MPSKAGGAALVVLVLALLGIGISLYYPVTVDEPADSDGTTVSIEDANGTRLATVDVRLAQTRQERFTGLSETDSLENGSGMLFVHPEEKTQSYVMRNMSFALDIIFIDSEGRITTIHHAPVPEEGDGPYRGEAKYVLEVPRGWSNATGVTVGDRAVVPDSVTAE